MIKWVISIVFFLFIGSNATAQHTKYGPVPQAVIDAFNKKYPDTYVYEWEWEKKDKLYEAEFFLRGVKYEALFSPDGQWVHTERDVSRDMVPKAVMESLFSSEYANWKIDDIEEHSTPDHPVLYEIEVKMKGPKREVYLYYLPDGKLLREVVKK